MRTKNAGIALLVSLVLLLTACGPRVAAENEPYQIAGTMDYTNDFISAIFEEHAVSLVDMYAFVIRDEEWEIPVASQTLGFMSLDEANLHAEYTLQLPARPTAQQVDVDNDGDQDAGVQVFAVSYWPNVYGGPYSEGDDRSRGWPSGFSSVRTDPERDDEVNGGKLIVWAPDARQEFPVGYGDDNLLFTQDDPLRSLLAGWTVVDLDQEPFAFIKEAEPFFVLYEPSDYSVKDYSQDDYVTAFDQMVEFLRMNYAFNGIPGKEPDWDSLVSELRPRVEDAQADGDAEAFYLALRDFTYAFKDGHVGLYGAEFESNLFYAQTDYGYGFAIRELDDGSFIVIQVNASGPAREAGIQVGAVISSFNGMPIAEAVAQVVPLALPQSAEWLVAYQQARYLLRAVSGDQAVVTFTNPGGEEQTATLQAVMERDSFARTSVYFNAPTYLLPVEFRILDSGVGYVAVNSEADDIQLTIRLFERALMTFEANQLPGIIIDMRYNGGGTPLGLAGFLTDQEIVLGQSYYYNENSQAFEAEGIPDKIIPNTNQYRFNTIAVLVGPACASACEEEAYGFSQVPGAEVVGMFPSSSMFGEVSRGQFILPEGFSVQFPTGRYLLPDGSLFLEGTGVQPTIRVPMTADNAISTEDVILQTAEAVVLGTYSPTGSGSTGGTPASTAARLMSKSATQAALSSMDQLEQAADESYPDADYLKVPFTFSYTIDLNRSTPLLWAWGWCAMDDATLEDNLARMDLAFSLDGEAVPEEDFLQLNYESEDGQSCMAYLVGVTDWPSGETRLVTTLTFTQALNDGTYDFPAGEQVFDYVVTLP